MKRRFRILGRLEYASRVQTATVTIDPIEGTFAVRPLRRRRTYVLPLAAVAEIVVRRTIFLELAEKRRERKRRRAARRAA